VADSSELIDLNPFDLLDAEAARIEGHLSRLEGPGWEVQSRCADWSVRDVLAHLLASEDYHRACLDGNVSGYVERVTSAGAVDLASINAAGVAAHRDLEPDQLLASWTRSNAGTRRGFRQRGDGTVDTSVGDYPCRLQAFHVASELAVHADDMYVPITPDEEAGRTSWRVRFSRFALAEAKPGLRIAPAGDGTRIASGGTSYVVADRDLVEGVAGRLDPSHALPEEVRDLLSTMP
jgi:uncharacterized protein (TIGR03083 family)